MHPIGRGIQGAIAVFCAGLIVSSESFAQGRPYDVTFAVYRISYLPITSSDEEYIDANLQTPISFKFPNTPLSDILALLGERHSLRFVQPEGIDTSKLIPQIEVKNVTLRKALTLLLAKVNLGYRPEGNVIHIVPLSEAASETATDYQPSTELHTRAAGAIRIGDTNLALGRPEGELVHAGLKNDPHVRFVSQTSLGVNDGQRINIRMDDREPVQYFTPDPKTGADAYRLRKATGNTGLTVQLLLQAANPDSVDVEMALAANYLQSRDPLERSDLDVGAPRFLRAETSGSVRIGLDRRTAFLTQLGSKNDEVLLILMRVRGVDANGPVTTADPKQVVAAPDECFVNLKIVHVRGEPDWERWGGKYPRLQVRHDGPGKVFGPVDMTHFKNFKTPGSQLPNLGFNRVDDEKVFIEPQMTAGVDLEQYFKSTIPVTTHKLQIIRGWRTPPDPTETGDVSFASHTAPDLAEFYNRFALARRDTPFAPEDVLARSFLIASEDATIPYGRTEALDEKLQLTEGLFASIKAQSVSAPGRYLLEQFVEFRSPKLRQPAKPLTEDGARQSRFEGYLQYDYEVENGTTAAFLLPVEADEYVVVLSEFGIIPRRGPPRPEDLPSAPVKVATALPQYALDTRVIQVRGEPDWQWWMQPYARAYKIYEGAGRVLGPVVVPHLATTPKKFDWGRLGFSEVTLPSAADYGAFGIASVVDPRFPRKKWGVSFRADASRPPRPAVDPSHEGFVLTRDLYKKVAPDAPPLTPEDLQGKSWRDSTSFALDASGQMVSQCPQFVIGEASPTPNDEIFRVDQKVLLNKPRLETKSPGILRQLEFSCDTTDGSLLAFLLPIAEDEYWVILTEFSLVKE